jgi:hypothetical protein
VKKALSFMLALSLALPGVLAVTTVKSGLVGFAEGMKGLFKGNVGVFVDGLLAAAPVIGLFVVVFGLIFFLTKLTLFKDDAHSKYARMIAIGIGLIGIAQQSVFNTILGWTTIFLTLGFIAAIIFMFVMFINHGRKSHYKMNKEMFGAQKGFLESKSNAQKAKREFTKVEHELNLDNKLYSKTERDLGSLNSDLKDMTKIYGDELRQANRLAELLRKATAAANRGDKDEVHGYVRALSRDLGSLITTMDHEGHDNKKAHALLNHIRQNLAYAFKDEKDELDEEAHIKKILKRHLHHAHNLSDSLDDDKIEGLVKRVMSEESDLHKYLIDIRNSALSLKKLEDKIEKHMEHLKQFGYQSKHDAAGAVRDAIMTQDFVEAHNQLDHLIGLIKQGREQVNVIGNFEREMSPIVSKIEEREKSLTILIHDMRASLLKEIKIETKDVRHINFKKLKNS